MIGPSRGCSSAEGSGMRSCVTTADQGLGSIDDGGSQTALAVGA